MSRSSIAASRTPRALEVALTSCRRRSCLVLKMATGLSRTQKTILSPPLSRPPWSSRRFDTSLSDVAAKYVHRRHARCSAFHAIYTTTYLQSLTAAAYAVLYRLHVTPDGHRSRAYYIHIPSVSQSSSVFEIAHRCDLHSHKSCLPPLTEFACTWSFCLQFVTNQRNELPNRRSQLHHLTVGSKIQPRYLWHWCKKTRP